jgi:uncharacterized protein
MSREFQVFVKPVGSTCNLSCSYCYYLYKKDLYPGKNRFIMDEDLLERYIIQQIEATTEQVVMFSWHGGEPTMAGLDFFRKAVRLQKKHLPAGKELINGIQTNGTLLDDEWCSFFAAEGFIIGISIDGPEELHNKYRFYSGGKPSFKKVLRGYELLRKHNVTMEILCVVNAINVARPLVVYNFFKQMGASYITFLPLVEPQLSAISGASADSVPAGEFGHFLTTIFDEWIENDIGKIKVQIFEEAARTAFNQEHTLCIFKVNCGGVPAVEHNGDFYSCDHYVNRDHLLGNIKEGSLANFLDSPVQKAFGNAKSETLPAFCLECNVRVMCNGGCPKNRFIKTPDGEPGLNYLCPGYKQFFTYCKPFIEAIRIASGENIL